jgi:hypothetical protein
MTVDPEQLAGIHCGAWLIDVKANEDHMPSKSLLHKPRPHHLPR